LRNLFQNNFPSALLFGQSTKRREAVKKRNRFFLADVSKRFSRHASLPKIPPQRNTKMKFANHLFISYARLDNAKTDENGPGWVDRFHTALKGYLGYEIGDEARIWRDPELRANEELADEIAAQLPKTALLVSLISPRYLKSDWCLTEIKKFCEAAEAQGGLVIDNKMRICRVMLMPLETAELREKLPGKLKDQLGYPFYDKEEGGRFVRLDPRFGEKYKSAFNLKLAGLAAELAEVINKLEADEKAAPGSKPPEPSGPPKPVIYLAECSWDRENDRDKIWSELRATGYTVLPEQGARLPDLEQEYAAEVEQLMDRSQLSVHIVGASGGTVLNGPGRRDAVQFQNEIAARKSEASGLPRLIWLPAATSQQPEQQSFIDALRSKAELQRGGDLIEDNLEAFKNSLRIVLKKLEEPPPKKAEAPNAGEQMIYLLCVPGDRPATVALRKFLRSKGFDVQLPVFEGDAASVRQSHDELLNRCDAVLIFYGAGNEAWKWTTRNDLEKIKSSRKEKPLLSVYTYLSSPKTDHKQDYIDMGEPNVINGLDGFSEAAIQPFLDTLKKA